MFRFLSSACVLSVFVAALSLPAAFAQVVLEADFENDDWAEVWQGAGRGTLKIVSEGDPDFVEHSGRALRIHVPEGGFLGTELNFRFRDHLEEEPEMVYLHYFLRLGSDWDTQGNSGKLPGFAGTYGRSGWGGRPSDGSTGWSARGMFSADGDGGGVWLGTYAYHADMERQYGDNWRWDRHANGRIRPGRWVRVEQFIRLNHPDRADGELRAWVDGREVLRQRGIRFRRNDELRVETVWMNVYHGGKTPAQSDLHLDIDEVRIHVGPMPARRPGS